MIFDKNTITELCENAIARHISYRLALKSYRLPIGDAHDAARSIIKNWSVQRMTHFWRASKEPNQFRPHRWWAHELKVRRAEIERWSQQLRAIDVEAVDADGKAVTVRLFRKGVEHLSRNNSKDFGGGGCAVNLGREARTTLEAAESVIVSTEKQTETNADNYVGAMHTKQGDDLPANESAPDRIANARETIRGARGEQLSLVPNAKPRAAS